MPNADKCVPCLEATGDVELVKRYDEKNGQGEVISTVFFHNVLIESSIERARHTIAPDESFDIALGDDSHLGRNGDFAVEAGYGLAEAFLDEEEEHEEAAHEFVMDAAA